MHHSYVCCAYLIHHTLSVPADATLVIVLSDADGVDELFFGSEGIVKGLYFPSTLFVAYQALLSHPRSLVSVQVIYS